MAIRILLGPLHAPGSSVARRHRFLRQSGKPRPCFIPAPVTRYESLRVFASPPKRGDDEGESEEASKVQETLVDILNLQIGYKKVKDMVSEESAKLTEVADQLKEEIDRSREQTKEMNDESFLEAMEKLDQISRDAEAELKSRSVFQDLEKDKDNFEAWEAQMEEERSAGQFFKQLYVDENRKKSKSMVTKEEMQAKAAAVQAEIDKELRNPTRMVIYIFLTTVLLGAATEDALTETPAWGRIGLYVVIALFFMFNLMQEVKYLNGDEPSDDSL